MSDSALKGDWPCCSSWSAARRIFSVTVNSATVLTLFPHPLLGDLVRWTPGGIVARRGSAGQRQTAWKNRGEPHRGRSSRYDRCARPSCQIERWNGETPSGLPDGTQA